ncbi:MAG: hypothetical protein JRN54_01140, partial [Nitrososphaerota archaeon]|nr:hypothetical protein [Nitrososphaerota archaeon]
MTDGPRPVHRVCARLSDARCGLFATHDALLKLVPGVEARACGYAWARATWAPSWSAAFAQYSLTAFWIAA